MTSESVIKSDALVVGVRPYGNSDSIVSMWVRGEGELKVFLRGGRKLKNKSRLATSLYRSLRVELKKSSSADFYSLREHNLRYESKKALTDYEFQLSLYDIIETASRIGGLASEDLFDAFESALRAVDGVCTDELAFYILYIVLIESSGHMPNTSHALDDSEIIESMHYSLKPGSEGFQVNSNGALGGNEIKLVRLLRRGWSVSKLLNLNASIGKSAVAELKEYCKQLS